MNEQSGELTFDVMRNMFPDNLQDKLKNDFNSCKDQSGKYSISSVCSIEYTSIYLFR